MGNDHLSAGLGSALALWKKQEDRRHMDPLSKLRSLVRIRAQVEAGEFIGQLQQGQQHILAECWMPDVQNPGVTGPTHS